MSDSVFVECPNCKELTEYGAQTCPRCREEIDPQYADASAAAVYVNTQACNMANTIKGGDPFVYLSLLFSAGAYAIDKYAVGAPALFYFVLAYPLLPLLAIVVWFNRYALFKAGDEEFTRARRDMRGSLLLWLAIWFVLVIAFLTLRG